MDMNWNPQRKRGPKDIFKQRILCNNTQHNPLLDGSWGFLPLIRQLPFWKHILRSSAIQRFWSPFTGLDVHPRQSTRDRFSPKTLNTFFGFDSKPRAVSRLPWCHHLSFGDPKKDLVRQNQARLQFEENSLLPSIPQPQVITKLNI